MRDDDDEVTMSSASGEGDRRLTEWGRWNRSNLGGPEAIGCVLGQFLSGPRQSSDDMPPSVAEVESIVLELLNDLREVIKAEYLWSGHAREKAKRLGFSRKRYSELLFVAQYEVGIRCLRF